MLQRAEGSSMLQRLWITHSAHAKSERRLKLRATPEHALDSAQRVTCWRLERTPDS